MLRYFSVAVVIVPTILGMGCSQPHTADRRPEQGAVFIGWNMSDSSRPRIQVEGDSSKEILETVVPLNVEVIIDGRSASLEQLKKGMRIVLVPKDKAVRRIIA